MQANTAMKATGGRDASRERRSRLVQGKTHLPLVQERTGTGRRHTTASTTVEAPVPKAIGATTVASPATVATTATPAKPATSGLASTLGGREASRVRRAGLVQGKTGLRSLVDGLATSADSASSVPAPLAPPIDSVASNGRRIAQAMRAARAQSGRGESAPSRPSGRARKAEPIKYPPKVADTQTYAGKKVTGVRIGRGPNMTGDEAGTDKQVTGTQYIGRETGFSPREGGVKVGASRTPGGQVVTGTQVRSKIMITGDESKSGTRITGEADQDVGDDVMTRREQGAYVSMQFERQNNPHGHTVFGTNLGRSAKSVGSRSRDTERAIEKTDTGLPISGTAVGRSMRVTGDEAGSCHAITGDQYLMPAGAQPLCEADGKKARARVGVAMGMNGRPDPVSGEKVVVSESWTRQRVTGVDVEHNANVTGDEFGVCSPITGTPYVGPGQYEAFCETGDAADAVQLATPGLSVGNRVTGDTVRSVDYVTGTQRGSERAITGTPYYRADVEDDMKTNVIERVNKSFSVRSPQRDGQLKAGFAAADAPSAESRITGTFAAGHGKITGNQEFHFAPRPKAEHAGRTIITGEGRVAGPAITGSAWTEDGKVTGTEGTTAAERNPSERAGKPQSFAGSTAFKDKGKHEPARQIVTGMVGWSAKSAAKVTLSGGAQG